MAQGWTLSPQSSPSPGSLPCREEPRQVSRSEKWAQQEPQPQVHPLVPYLCLLPQPPPAAPAGPPGRQQPPTVSSVSSHQFL